MATNKELEAQVKSLTGKVNHLEEVIPTLCEVVLELIEVTNPINEKHAVLQGIASELAAHIPKKSG